MKIGFIGCGHMGSALALAIGGGTEHEVYLSDHHTKRVRQLADLLGAKATDALQLAAECDYIFLGVKPKDMAALLRELQPALEKNPHAVLISMAAGISISTLYALQANQNKVIRILPNTPVAVGEGMTVYCADGNLTNEQETLFVELMRPTGCLQRIDEALIDAACVVAGCGPAYAYLFADALAKAGACAGLDYEAAKIYAAQMMRGAATMMLNSEKSPKTLCDEVCSPGGSTIEGVKVFQNEDLPGLVQRAFDVSYKRTVELGQVK